MMRLTDRLVTTKEKHTSTYSRQGSKVREIQDPLDETEPETGAVLCSRPQMSALRGQLCEVKGFLEVFYQVD